MRHEDNKIMTRQIEKKRMETVILILAVALGVGVAAGGISLAASARIRSFRELALPQYREIKISTRTEVKDFDAPALLNEETKKIFLSPADLAASDELPYITGGYIMQEQNYRLGEQLKGEPEPLVKELHGYAVSEDFFSIRELTPETGRLFTQEDRVEQRPLMILGSDIADSLYKDKITIGQKLLVFDRIYTISAVLNPTGTEFDNRIFTPIQERMTSYSRNEQHGASPILYLRVKDKDQLFQSGEQLITWFNAKYGPGAVNIEIPLTEAVAAIDRNGRLTTLILFFALSGLLIASVNVSNILMGRALRRSQMIGVLKALGASKKRIFMLFFEEALMIGLTGSIFGVGFALFLTSIMTKSMGIQSFSLAGVAGGTLLALTLTMLLTLFPAFKASQIKAGGVDHV